MVVFNQLKKYKVLLEYEFVKIFTIIHTYFQDCLKIQNNMQRNVDLVKLEPSHKHEMPLNSKKNSQFNFKEYCVKDNQSLYSYFSSNQVEEPASLKNNSMNVQQPQLLKVDIISLNNHSTSSEGEKNLGSIEQYHFRKFQKIRLNQDIFQAEISNNQTIQTHHKQQTCEEKQAQNRKTYTSYLHKAVDANHLQSPGRKSKKIGSQLELQRSEQKAQLLMETYKSEKPFETVQNGKNKLCLIKQQDKNTQQCRNEIKPLIKITKKVSQSSQSPKSPQISPQRSSKNDNMKVQPRMIPSDLFVSYEELNLTVNKNLKTLNKKNDITEPIKLKQKASRPQKQKLSDQKQKTKKSQALQTNSAKIDFDQELFASLPMIEGYCGIKTQTSDLREKKFVIYKNQFAIQSFKRLNIQNISKIKFMAKDQQQIFIKLSYETENSGQNAEVILINVICLSETAISQQQSNFYQSYQIFSQIILRKLLLMNITINSLHEQNDKGLSSPRKSPINSPLNSPMSLPNSLSRKPSQSLQLELPPEQSETEYEADLYKRQTFFNSWQKKYFRLSASKGLQSFSSQSCAKTQKPKPSSQLHKTTQIWTRFQLIYGYLNIKMWQNKIQKSQVGIPLCDFTNSNNKNNWLYGLCKYLI